ncbi:hypothetical protein ACI6Q2_21715 [Chitinophagaceae bacterium LWZ2-11]
MKGLKQGKWVIRNEDNHGEPGYEEEGVFKEGKKEGPWRVYTLQGDFTALENYRWGNKDGISQYYNLAGLEHEESWKAFNPENPYDTIDVPDVNNPDKVERKVIKVDGHSMKNGIWKYYRPGSLTLLKTETYFLDKLQTPKIESQGTPSGQDNTTSTLPAKDSTSAKPKQVLDFEKKNSGKKASKVRDGQTGN